MIVIIKINKFIIHNYLLDDNIKINSYIIFYKKKC